ncbi:hypothetical protein AAFC00_000746 [Neodothiora populina]|uniref:FAD dependent oxidoreductase domain-containing protein n=1 Tax=Neodothiora populina TaxID=2781224 RepID=A0ABR3PDW7_9PEZI
MSGSYVILGAGVVGLTTALELHKRYPDAKITLVAKFLPGDRHPEYASPWAGANWLSVATDNGRQEDWDAVTYERLKHLANDTSKTGVRNMEIYAVYDNPIEDAGVLSVKTKKIWYESLVGGLRMIPSRDLPSGVAFGYELDTFVIDTQVYLPWLQSQVLASGIAIHRAMFDSIEDLFRAYPGATAYFNCTGLGSYSLKGVEDKNVYPTRGQVMLVENPPRNLDRMYFRSPRRVDKDTTYIFPRGPHGGVILGGCRLDNVWDGKVDLGFAEDIKRRCCALAPELGKPEDLKVISHAVGLRPSRKGGARLERQQYRSNLVIHNYGAGGAGYQASWGMAKEAVDLLKRAARL